MLSKLVSGILCGMLESQDIPIDRTPTGHDFAMESAKRRHVHKILDCKCIVPSWEGPLYKLVLFVSVLCGLVLYEIVIHSLSWFFAYYCRWPFMEWSYMGWPL